MNRQTIVMFRITAKNTLLFIPFGLIVYLNMFYIEKTQHLLKKINVCFFYYFALNIDENTMIMGYDTRYLGKDKRIHTKPSSAGGALRSKDIYPDRITFDEIEEFVKTKQEDRNLMITICDKGYLSVFRLFYRINKMEQYTNFVVFILDKEGYDVQLVWCNH